MSLSVIGSKADIKKLRAQYDVAIVALGSNIARMRYHAELKKFGYTIPVLIHPTAYVSPNADVSIGCIIRANAVVSRFVKLDESCIIKAGALIDHHVVIGAGCHVLMGAVVRNKTEVKPLTRVESLCVVQ